MIWPVLYQPEDNDEDVVLRRITEVGLPDVPLPPMHNEFFKGKSVEYKYQSIRRGLAARFRGAKIDISSYGAHVPVLKKISTVTYAVNEGLRTVRGFIERAAQDFRLAPVAGPGVIPPAEQAPDASAATGGPEAGGTSA